MQNAAQLLLAKNKYYVIKAGRVASDDIDLSIDFNAFFSRAFSFRRVSIGFRVILLYIAVHYVLVLILMIITSVFTPSQSRTAFSCFAGNRLYIISDSDHSSQMVLILFSVPARAY